MSEEITKTFCQLVVIINTNTITDQDANIDAYLERQLKT